MSEVLAGFVWVCALLIGVGTRGGRRAFIKILAPLCRPRTRPATGAS